MRGAQASAPALVQSGKIESLLGVELGLIPDENGIRLDQLTRDVFNRKTAGGQAIGGLEIANLLIALPVAYGG